MKPSERRKQMKAEMEERLKDSYNTKDDSGRYKSVLNKSMLGNVGMWKCKEDEHFLDIIPFVAGKHHPTLKEGKMAVNLDIYVHRKVGVNEDDYICLAKTYGKPCPICEEQANIRKQENFDNDYAKSLNPTRRVVYNIVCRDNNTEVAKGIQIFDVSHYLFEKKLAELSRKPRGGGFILYTDPDEGKTIFFRKKGNSATNTEYSAFQFEEREEPISDALLDAALCLDDLLVIPTYQQVANAFYGHEEEEVLGEAELNERRHEADARNTSASEPEPEQKEEEFECPGDSAADYGKFDACDSCPDADACEGEYKEIEEARLAKEAADKKAAESETRPARVVRRPAATAPAAEEKAPASEPAEKPAEEAAQGRRVRRRPGA